MDKVGEFLDFSIEIIKLYDSNKISLNEAALRISSFGISLRLWDDGPKNIKEIIGLAIDLEVPEEAYKGDIHSDWKSLDDKIRALNKYRNK